jgi:hypothetical protein
MSFRLFIYYCTAWGATAAFFGWLAGHFIEVNSPLLGAAINGLALGLFVALGVGVVDALAVSSQRNAVAIAVRLMLSLMIGGTGGLLGGLIGQGFYQLSDGRLSELLVLGWMLTGLLIGAAPAAFDFLAAVLRNEDRRGVNRKLRNGLLGGTLGGMMGGIVSLLLHSAWGHVFVDPDSRDLWSPSATGFVALGASIGLAVALAQIILREAWVRVEAGFRPGREVLLTRPETTIGRAEACDLGLFGDPTIERKHAKILREDGRWMLVDTGTVSGTLLNGQRISEPTALRSGDRIQVGASVLSFGVRSQK